MIAHRELPVRDGRFLRDGDRHAAVLGASLAASRGLHVGERLTLEGQPYEVVGVLERMLTAQDLAGEKILVTAGPTQEAIDPVRFVSNRSSGKMGYALAEAAKRRGATVTLVSGPTSLPAPAGVDVKQIMTASEMYDAVMQRAPQNQIANSLPM